MDQDTRRGIETFLKTASTRQLQTTLLELTTSLMTVFTEPDVVADAKQLVQRIRAELALRPTERYLRAHLASPGLGR
jgi:hypothetical protein